MRLSHLLWASLLVLGCNQGGPIKGKVSVEGGSAAGLPVFVFGPQSVAAVTDAEGNFSTSNVIDGAYVVRVTVQGAEAPEQTASTAVTQGKQVGDVALSFKLPSASVTGTVVLSDGSAPTGVVVSLTGGPEARSLAVGTDGAFTFDKLRSGTYTLTAAGANTLEGQVSQAVSAASGTPVDVGMVKLTPFGRLEGTVSGMGTRNVRVSIAGQSFAATPDAMGAFAFDRVPAGMHTVIATAATDPVGTASASATVTVSRGATATAMLALTNDPPRTGVVKGSVTYLTASPNSDISVHAQGLAMPAATPDATGGFSLTLPVGRWVIEATAPAPFPPKVLGRVDVVEGQTVTLPAGEMSLFVPVLDAIGGVNDFIALNWTATHVLYRVQTGASNHWTWYVLDRTTLASRAIYTGQLGSVTETTLSAKYAVLAIDIFASASSIFLYDVTNGQTATFGMSEPGRSVDIGYLLSSDDRALFLATTPQGMAPARVERITLGATPTRVGFDNFIAFGVDRAFYRQTTGTTFSVFAVNVGDAPTSPLFSNASLFIPNPTPWARTACTTPNVDCTLAIAMPTANTSNPVPQVRGTVTVATSNGRYPVFSEAVAGRLYRVDAMSGGAVILPVNTVALSIVYSPDNTRFAYLAPAGLTANLREEPTATATGLVAPVFTGVPAPIFRYVSNLRLIAVSTNATTLQIVDVKAASATAASSPTTITDVRQPSATTPAEWMVQSAEAVWRTTSGRVGMLVGDSAIATVDALAQPFQFNSVPIETPNFPYGVLRQSGASFIVNMSNGMASAGPSPGLDLSGVRLKTKAWISSSVGLTYFLTDPMTGRTFPVSEPWLRLPFLRFSGAGNLLAMGASAGEIYFAPNLP